MGAKPRSLWQQIKQHPFIIAGIIVVVFALTAFTIAVIKFGWGWTGFTGGDSKVTTTMITPGTTTTTTPRATVATEQQPAKTLWDWLGLLATLAIPVVVGFGAAWFTAQLGKASDRRNSLEQMKNQKIVENQFQQAILQSYLDRMSELLLEKNLRLSSEDNEVRKVARARTLATLLTLDGVHKGNLLQFLSESGLIDRNRSVIDLRHADLSSTYLHGAVLQSINLVGANLSQADLSEAYLIQTDLSEANLSQANLEEANLEEANLIQANLSKANLYHTNLREANLSRAKLKGALLEVASLENATLENADLEDASLEMAYLFGANLREANLRKAYLFGAMVEDEEAFVETHSLQGATMPDGSIHP
jgi:uncharacterized protein YjbI with pentapeptide repeats